MRPRNRHGRVVHAVPCGAGFGGTKRDWACAWAVRLSCGREIATVGLCTRPHVGRLWWQHARLGMCMGGAVVVRPRSDDRSIQALSHRAGVFLLAQQRPSRCLILTTGRHAATAAQSGGQKGAAVAAIRYERMSLCDAQLARAASIVCGSFYRMREITCAVCKTWTFRSLRDGSHVVLQYTKHFVFANAITALLLSYRG